MPCVAAELYCRMNYPSELSVDIATAMSTWGSGISSHVFACFSR